MPQTAPAPGAANAPPVAAGNQPYHYQPYDYQPYDPYEMLPYEDGDPIPPGYIVKTEHYRALSASGAVIAGHVYGLTALVGIFGVAVREYDFGYFLIPIAGPWLFIPARNIDTDVGIALYAMNGVSQLAGLSMLIAGAVANDQYLVRANDIALTVAPIAGEGYQGVGLVGAF